MDRKWIEVAASDFAPETSIAEALNDLRAANLRDVQVIFCGNDNSGTKHFRIIGTVDASADVAALLA